jgi:hypothetical protein
VPIKGVAAALASLAFVVACAGSPTGPSATDDNWLTATIDGQPFRASIVAAFIASSDGRQILNLTGLEGCDTGWTVHILAERLNAQPFTTGEYSTGRSIQVGTPAAFAVYRELIASVFQVREDVYWDAPDFRGGGSGTLNVSSLTGTHVEGTFSFQAPPRQGNGDTKSVTNGAFRARLQDRRIC